MPVQDGVWIAIGDIHDHVGNFAKIPELSEARGVIITGDLTNSGGPSAAEKVFAAIAAAGLPVFAQVGNMDLMPVNDWFEQKGVNIHGHVRELAPELAICGIGGSTFTPMHTPTEFAEDDYRAWLAAEWPELAKYPCRILISHNPPADTLCDDIGGGVHVGSKAVREFIEQHKPDACICGHIHEGVGCDMIGQTPVINPGQLAEGGYVVIRAKDGRVTAELKKVSQ
ncbi:MAG: serine/threonine protein phosphatase [Desulfovibrio sp.]|nr:serine/threonine protein phosphatase [Desulfovibrio sp.]